MSFSTPVRAKSSRECQESPRVQIPPSPFMHRLGYGTGVCVYLLPNRPNVVQSPWAVKKVNTRITSHDSKEFEARIKKEASILKNLDHPNIVGYRAESRSGDGALCLCMESSEKSLESILEQREEEALGPLPPQNIFMVAQEVARALNYLHSNKHLLHGDIKSGNVLIKGNFKEVKLCDFGVAVQLNDTMVGVRNECDYYVGTKPFTALEALNGDEISHKTDIYAYGCLLYEMLTLRAPHSDFFENSAFGADDSYSFDEDAYEELLGSRPALPSMDYSDKYQCLIELFCVCTEEDLSNRPSASQILSALEEIKHTII